MIIQEGNLRTEPGLQAVLIIKQGGIMDLIEVKVAGGFMGSRERLMFRLLGDDCSTQTAKALANKVLDDETWLRESDAPDQLLYRFEIHVSSEEWHSINMFESSVPDDVKDIMDELAHSFQKDRNR